MRIFSLWPLHLIIGLPVYSMLFLLILTLSSPPNFHLRAVLPFGAFVCLLSGMYLLFTSPAGVFSLIWPIGGKQTFPLPPLAALPPLAPPPSLTPPPPIAPPPPTTRMGTASWLWVGVKRTTEVNKPASGDRKE